MNIIEMTVPAFCVIGKEGSTADGPGFVQRLWEDANGHFSEVEPLAPAKTIKPNTPKRLPNSSLPFFVIP